MIITSRSNPQLKEIAKLNDKKFRQERGEYLVEGTKPVEECIKAGGKIVKIVCTEKYAENFIDPIVVGEEAFGAVSTEKTPQGVAAVVKMPENTLVKATQSCLLLDRLQDPGNIGTIIRTANAAGFKHIYMINCADPYSPKAVRASMSGIFFVDIHQGGEEEILSCLTELPLIAADMDGENIFGFYPPEKFCLCIGNEGSGLGRNITAKAAYKVKIPMEESCESLNAAVSAGIAMYALQRRFK